MAPQQTENDVKRPPLKNDVALTSRFPSIGTTEANLIRQNTVGRHSILKSLRVAAVGAVVMLQLTTAFAQQTYLIVDLGTLPGATTASATAINNNGQIVGSSG